MSEMIDRDMAKAAIRKALNGMPMALMTLPSEQPEITDEQAILHLQSTGWMQNHDREMYESGLRERLADDSGSYDSIIPCKDTISRQAAIDALADMHCKSDEDGYVWIIRSDAWARIDALPSAQPEKQHGRIFQEIVVEYPSISTYPEHKGKPYFSIKYTENGQEFIGYGTYKPEVLSEYLKEYFMTSAQQETHEKRTETHACDLIDRQAAIDALHMHLMYRMGTDSNKKRLDDWINGVPSAQPERKKGDWIDQDRGAFYSIECSECHKEPLLDEYGDYVFSDFCPNCGADMRGEQNETN